MFHLFVHLVRSAQDPFAGLRKAVANEGGQFGEIRFTEAELDLIDSVEYTSRRPFRFWHYRKLFQSLEGRLDEALSRIAGPVCVYLADEGVWAVFWENYRRRTGRRNIRAVNVQHGFALREPASHKRLRRFANAGSTALTGYPAIGYGSAGGAGPGPFDVYLTYDQATADFATFQSGMPAIPSARLIKHDLISRFAKERVHQPDRRALFAMNIAIAGSPILFTSNQTYDELLPVAAALRHKGFDLVIRLHPGMDRAKEERIFAQHPIAKLALMDKEEALHKAMAASSIVMSYLSTSLWEGGLLGLLPVQVLGKGCRPVTLGYPTEQLDMSMAIETQVAEICRKARPLAAFDWKQAEQKEWTETRKLILGTS